ncbi:MltA domain-containing protein [Jannaschia ovalis]|uniref:peptidoglycan lytic exotransglycosylase n=1 Tax=Jannaschia ovalis TaxID=3038773 RepID=A0ABY8LG58_9RHOB|nr:MltA domain-containing protein [Jannaschia sp. GRR-S6-38]WGH80284.1 MltA domain-containing protein [Jannaschia sp. GRR-S6-38]
MTGWDADDLDAALAAFRLCSDGPLVQAAKHASDARRFFESRFRPGAELAGHFTGYYEPEIPASLTRSDAFPVPIHAMPPGGVSATRAEISPFLAGQEIAWLRDEVDRFFLQVQGSGRLRLPGGATMRVGHAGKNGQPYVSIGKLSVERGVFGPGITADALKDWLRADPDRGHAVMNENPSYVFFEILDLPEGSGPRGTLCPVTSLRSLAVDPTHTPLGTPVWIEVAGHARLCIAQDTGSAIKGAGRADLFFGSGDTAGRAAGALNHPGRFVPLVPR